MANDNEYRVDGKIYVKAIKRCEVEYIWDGKYQIFINIHQRGQHFYTYEKGSDSIRKSYKTLFLDKTAKEQLQEITDEYDAKVQSVCECTESLCIPYSGHDVTMYVLSTDNSRYDIVAQNTANGYIRLFENARIKQYYSALYTAFGYPRGNENWELFHPDNTCIYSDPLYLKAKSENREMLINELEMCFGIKQEEAAGSLEGADNVKRLVRLPKEYDKDYAVVKNTVSFDVVYASGYEILHRPAFAMGARGGSTRENITLNPHTKTGVDAAYTSNTPITFDEYVRMIADESATAME